jgi:glycosyltransferase involved in cell wall biosynthesis
MEFSIIIPTYERMDVLPEVLDAAEGQQDAPAYEIVVVDDGSGDGTGDWLKSRAFTVPYRIVSQSNQGPAAARNLGVREARGRLVAFLGDDTVPSTGWLASHARAHRRRPGEPLLAVIGYTGWHPRMRLTPFLRYINDHGLQFGYARIDDPEDVPFNFLYTSNLSLPRAALLDEPFDLAFPYPAWEDIELGYRLKKKGLRLIYAPEARAVHDHPTDLARFQRRQEKAGYCAVVFYQRHPELSSFLGVGEGGPPPLPPERRQRWLEELARALQHTPLRTPRLWERILRYHYIQGLHRGWRDRVSPGCGTADQADARKGD